MNLPTIDQLHLLASKLDGACGGPSPALLQECGIDPRYELNEIDRNEMNLRYCPGCGYWFGVEEFVSNGDELLCGSCAVCP